MVTSGSKATPRGDMYVWVTWLAALLAGTGFCEWAVQFMAQYKGYDKVQDGFDLSAWIIEHTSMLQRRRVELEAAGALVRVEDQNKFTLRGLTGTLAGKPDLVVFPDPTDFTVGVVEDVKTGAPRPSDVAQVLLYMMSLHHCFPQYKNTKFAGRVIYKDHVVEIPANRLDATFMNNFKELWTRLASKDVAAKIPSAAECRFCKLTSVDCAERIEAATTTANTDLF